MKTFMGICAETIIDKIAAEGHGFVKCAMKMRVGDKTCYCLAGAISHLNGVEYGENEVRWRTDLKTGLDLITLDAMICGFDGASRYYENPVLEEAYSFGVYARQLAEQKGLLYS